MIWIQLVWLCYFRLGHTGMGNRRRYAVRYTSWQLGTDRKWSKNFGSHPENVVCHRNPL